MPRPRFERAAPEKRQALLQAAAKEFAEHGYDGASVNRILLAAGLSKGAFYYYFDDKADLAATVLAHESAEWIDTVGSLPLPDTAEEFWEAMSQLNERGMAELRQSPGRTELLTRLGVAAARNPELMQKLGPFFKEARDRLAGFYRRGQEVGAVRADLSVDVVMTILQGAKQAVGLALLPTDRTPTAEELAEFARVNFDCLRRLAIPPQEEEP